VPFGVVVGALSNCAGARRRSLLRALDEEMLAELAALLPYLLVHEPQGDRRARRRGEFRPLPKRQS
jgi:hypothetical protein